MRGNREDTEQWREGRDIERWSWGLRKGGKKGERQRDTQRETEAEKRRPIRNYTFELVHSSRAQVSLPSYSSCVRRLTSSMLAWATKNNPESPVLFFSVSQEICTLLSMLLKTFLSR